MYKNLLKVKEMIAQNEFLKTIVTAGCVAAVGCTIYAAGKVVGKWIAMLGLF